VRARATVVYDDDCGFCRWSAERLRTRDRRHALRFVTLRSDEAERLLGLLPGGGLLSVVTAAMPDLTETAYTAIARRRSALGRLLGQRACSVDPSRGQATSQGTANA
jgi:predicted DCC family thiol-disulfide oxidoreductase YuxK